MSDKYVVVVVGIACITILGISYFMFIRQDSTVLLSLSGVIGAIIGYLFPKRKK